MPFAIVTRLPVTLAVHFYEAEHHPRPALFGFPPLSNPLGPEEIRQVVLTSSRLDIACARLIEAAKQRGGDDNITAIVAGVSGDVPRAVSGESIAETFFVIQEFQPPSQRDASAGPRNA